jgi:hypothetical protein
VLDGGWKGKITMLDWKSLLIMAGVLAAWFLLMRVILPKAGIPT